MLQINEEQILLTAQDLRKSCLPDMGGKKKEAQKLNLKKKWKQELLLIMQVLQAFFQIPT